MNVSVIDNTYAKILLTDVRDNKTEKEELRNRLLELGRVTAQEIIADNLVTTREVTTPMGQQYSGFEIPRTTTVIISTRDDYEYFAEGISSAFSYSHKGFMDFNGERGQQALQGKRRAIEYPNLKKGEVVDTLVIAKSVLATGCTAISLTKTAVVKYHPKKIIIASLFYSEQGIQELLYDIPNLDKIYIHGSPDTLNNDGMLVPGVGDLDARLAD